MQLRRFFAAATAFGLAAAPAQAEVLKNFRFGGQIDVMATSANNATDFQTYPDNPAPVVTAGRDRIGDTQTRVLLFIDWDLLDDVHSRLTLRKNNRVHGENSEHLNTVQNNVFVDEAHFKVDKLAGAIDLTAGRQFYGESNDIVIYYGPSDKAWFTMPVSAIDAFRADWNGEHLTFTGLAGRTNDPNVFTAADASTDVRGLILTLKGNDHIRASVYGWNRVVHRVAAAVGTPPGNAGAADNGGKNDNLYVVGLKMRLAGGGFWLKSEFAQNFGTLRAAAADPADAPAANYIGWAAFGNTGFKVESDDVGTFSIWGEGAIGSGRSSRRERSNDGFVPINGDYRPGAIYGRFAANAIAPAFAGLFSGTPNIGGQTAVPPASASLNNRVIFGGGIKMSPAAANRFQAGVSWWDFRLHRFANAPDTADPFRGNRHLGSELDVDLTWTHSENVTLGAGWATFQPGGLIYEAVRNAVAAGGVGGRGVNPATLTYFDVRVKF